MKKKTTSTGNKSCPPERKRRKKTRVWLFTRLEGPGTLWGRGGASVTKGTKRNGNKKTQLHLTHRITPLGRTGATKKNLPAEEDTMWKRGKPKEVPRATPSFFKGTKWVNLQGLRKKVARHCPTTGPERPIGGGPVARSGFSDKVSWEGERTSMSKSPGMDPREEARRGGASLSDVLKTLEKERKNEIRDRSSQVGG